MRRAALVLAGTTTLLALALAPAAQADPAVSCVDNKPAVGFSFTCDTALAVPPDGVAYPAPEVSHSSSSCLLRTTTRP